MSLWIVASIFASVFIFLLPTLPSPIASIGEYVRFHWLAVWQHLGGCHSQGCQGYALHSAAVRAPLASKAPPHPHLCGCI